MSESDYDEDEAAQAEETERLWDDVDADVYSDEGEGP